MLALTDKCRGILVNSADKVELSMDRHAKHRRNGVGQKGGKGVENGEVGGG